MLDVLKKMQENGVFKIILDEVDLDSLILNAQNINDIDINISVIKEYIQRLDYTLSNRYNVSIGNSICCFYDKINYELYYMYLASMNARTQIYEKENIEYGKAGNFRLGLKSNDVRFSLDERKLIKIINHYYITLMGTDFDDDLFYIPFENLNKMFSDGLNKREVKDRIIEACNRLDGKEVYWDFTNTTYLKSKKLSREESICSNGEKLYDITIIYQPWGQNVSIKGIVCKVTNFLRLRYSLKQINSKCPSMMLQCNYLEFSIIDRILYHITIGRKRNYFVKDLFKLVSEDIYDFKKNLPTYTPYVFSIKNDKHKPREQKKLLSAIINVANVLNTNNDFLKCRSSLIVNNNIIKIIENNKPKEVDDLYEDIIQLLNINSKDKDMMIEINKIYDKLKEKEDTLDVSLIYNFLMRMKKINKNKIESYIESSFENGIINLRKLKKCLIDDTNCVKRSQRTIIDKGILLKIDYKK